MALNYDYILLIAIVLVVYLIIGIIPLSKHNREKFLISGRRLGGRSNGFSIAASKIGGGLLVTYSTLFFAFGWIAIFYFAGVIIGYLFFYLFAHKLLDESKENSYYTTADYFTNMFGIRVGLVVGLLTTISALGWIFTNMVAGGIILGNLVNVPPVIATAVLALVIGIYLYVGGFNSVVKTDVIQYIAIVTIGIIFALLLRITDFQTQEYQVTSMPFGQIIGFIILGILFPMGSGELWQRIYASNSKKELKNSMLIASVSYLVVGIFLSIICIRIISVSPSTILLEKNELKLTLGIVDLVKNIHPVLPYIWIVALLSAIISTADTFVYTTASSFVQDLLQKSGRITAAQVVPRIKLAIAFLLIAGIIITYIFPDVVSITFLFVGISLVISSLAYFSRVEMLRESNRIFYISGLIGFFSVFSHFIAMGYSANIVTALIGFCTSAFFFSVFLLWERIRK